MLNDVKLVGRISREINLITTSGGKKMAVMNIAVNDSYNKDAKPEFISIFLWEKTAEYAAQYLNIGDLMLVNARLKNIQKEDKTELTVVAKTINRLASKNSSNATHAAPQSTNTNNDSHVESNSQPDDGMEYFGDGTIDLDEDIPF